MAHRDYDEFRELEDDVVVAILVELDIDQRVEWVARKLCSMERTVNRKLNHIAHLLEVLMADQAALDTAVADLVTHTDAIDSAVTALIDKINASPAAADFATEVAALQTATGNLQTATDAANSALTPPAPPA